MLPGSVDPRRPDKQQRYKPPPANNNAAPGEDLTPDYMNILDQQRKSMQTTCRSDRFKVVKIESTEPFKRGRWECMDFLDQSYNRVFQRNYARQVSNDTHLRPLSPNSNSDSQTSMLQIFYRQNNSIFDKNNSVCVGQFQQTVFECDKKYQNHVLRPGMVSSSLVGIKYPFELNFEKDESSPSKENLCKNRPASVSDCHVNCDNQKFQSMSSDYSNLPVYPNLNQDLLNNGQYIENTVPTQQNYSQIYQEQIITYVDNCIPQQRITTNTTEVFTTTFTPTTTDYNLNRQPNISQHQKIIDTPFQNAIEVPQLLYNPSTFQEDQPQYLPLHSESQIQSNIIYENKMGSVISSNSFENIVNEPDEYSISNKFETELKPGLQEVFEHNTVTPNSVSTPIIQSQTVSPPMSIYQEQVSTKPIEVDVSSLVACSAQQNKGSQSIDGKIEQLMDLVKKHLKFAVLEDVNDMKQQIMVLKGRVAQLEYENALLRSCEEKHKRQEHN